MAAQESQRIAHQRPAGKGAHRHQRCLAIGELQHLQRLGKLDQLDDVFGEYLLRADRKIHAEIIRAEHFLAVEIINGSDAGDAGRRVVETGCQFAGDQIDLIALRDGQQHVGIGDASLLKRGRVRGIAGQGAQIQPVLQLAQLVAVGIDDGNVVCLAHQAFRYRGTDLSCTEYQYFHSTP